MTRVLSRPAEPTPPARRTRASKPAGAPPAPSPRRPATAPPSTTPGRTARGAAARAGTFARLRSRSSAQPTPPARRRSKATGRSHTRTRPRTIKAAPRPRARRTIRARRSLATRFSAGQPRRRLLTTLVVLLLVFLLVLFKVGLLQTFQGDQLRAVAADQWTRDRLVRAARGSIFDRHGDELALSVPASTVAVDPRRVDDPAGTAHYFATILDLDGERQVELEAEMAARDRGFLYVARQVDPDAAQQLAELDLAGVTIYREDRRMLPGGVTARSVVGQTDIDGNGTAGLELQYNDLLQGTDGEVSVEVAPDGRSVPGSERVTTAPVPGTDVVTTIDRSVQYAVEQALLRRAAETRARGAQAVVMDTDTGEVIAMASVRLRDGEYVVTTGNHTAVDAYEPGSVGKVITIAAGLEEGTVTPQTAFYVPWRKQYTRAGDWLHDSHPHDAESMSVEDILVDSSNIGTITVSETFGFERQYEYMRAFGLGERTALDFPQESAGILKDWQTWEGTEKFTVAYGQGVASTPVQLVTAVNVIANDGLYVAPKLVLGTVGPDGELRPAEPSATHQVISEANATAMQQMMKQVVCRGTAEAAQVPGLSVAGKTGTGLVAQDDGTYFLRDGTQANYSSFVGFLPAEDPQVTILVSIDQPTQTGMRAGGDAAAPVFRDLAPVMVHELGIQPPVGSTGCEG